MTNRDLLHALHTRGKKLTRELDAFSARVDTMAPQEAWTVVLATLELVRELPPTHDKYGHVIKAVNRAWMAFAEGSEGAARRLYGTVVDLLEGTTWTNPDEAQAAWQLLNAFHRNELRFPSPNTWLRLALRAHAPRLLALVETLLPHAASMLFPQPLKPQRGVGTDAIGMLLELFFFHAGCGEDGDLRAQAGALLPRLVAANPEVGNNITLSLLEDHPERAAIVSELIGLYLAAGVDENLDGMFFSIMLDLVDNGGDSFLYADLDKIATHLERASTTWSDEARNTFARYAFFYGLKSDEDRLLFLAKSKKARRLAALIVGGPEGGEHVAALRTLLARCESSGQPAPARPASPGGGAQFRDLNFKLLVIQALMYEQQTLLPKFELDAFVRQHTVREIMIEEDGYAVIPEALAHFEQLYIPPALLAEVEELCFDGGNEIYGQVYPYWDGEDGCFDVRAVDDIALLPALGRIFGMTDRFIAEHANVLRARAIAVD